MHNTIRQWVAVFVWLLIMVLLIVFLYYYYFLKFVIHTIIENKLVLHEIDITIEENIKCLCNYSKLLEFFFPQGPLIYFTCFVYMQSGNSICEKCF